MTEDRPYVCPFPPVQGVRRGTRWTCPNCGYTYRKTRRIRPAWWRNWSAPAGMWSLTFRESMRLDRERGYR